MISLYLELVTKNFGNYLVGIVFPEKVDFFEVGVEVRTGIPITRVE